MSEHRHIGPLFSAEEETCLTHVQMHDYATGKISPADKHTVELHLLNCELCALAFEGIEADAEGVAAGAEAITAEAWKRVAALEKKRRRAAFVWMSSAAVILLLILVGFFVIDTQEEKNLNSLADSMYDLPESPLSDSNDESFAEAIVPTDMPNEERNKEFEPIKSKTDNQSGGDLASALEKAPNEVTSLQNTKTLELVDADVLGSADLEIAEEEVEDYYYAETEEILEKPVAIPPPAPKYEQRDVVANATIATSDLKDQTFKEEVAEDEAAFGSDFLISADSAVFRDGEMLGGYVAADEGSLDDSDDDFEVVDGLAEVNVQQEAVTSTGAIALNTPDLEQKFDRSLNMQPSRSISMDDSPVAASGKGKKSAKPRREKNKANDNRSSADPQMQPNKSIDANDKLSNNTDYYRRGLEAYENRDFSKGARYLRQAASDAPSNLQAHFYAGLCFMEIDQHTAALFHLDRIISQPQNSLTEDAMWYKSIALMRLGQKKKAEEVLEELRNEDGKRKSDAEKALKKL